MNSVIKLIQNLSPEKIFGSTYLIQTDKNVNSISKATKQYENDLFISDIILGSFIYISIIFTIKKVIQTIILCNKNRFKKYTFKNHYEKSNICIKLRNLINFKYLI